MDPVQIKQMKRLILRLNSDDDSVDSAEDSQISIDLESLDSEISINSFLKENDEHPQIGGAVTTRRQTLETQLPPNVPQLKAKKTNRKRKVSSTRSRSPLEEKERSPSPSTSKQARASPRSISPAASIAEDEPQPSTSEGLSENGFFDRETKIFENENFALYIRKQDHIKQKVSNELFD